MYKLFHDIEEEFGTNISEFLIPKKKEVRPNKNYLSIGNSLPNFNGFPIHIYLYPKNLPRIFVCSPTGSGKTCLISAMAFQAYQSGLLPLILYDSRGEYRQKLLEAAKFHNQEYLLKNEIIKFSPYFIRTKNSIPFQFDFDSVSSLEDINTVVGFSNREDSYKTIGLEELIQKIPRSQRTIRFFCDIINKKKIFHEMTEHNFRDITRQAIRPRLNRAKRYGVLGSQHRVNFSDYLIDYKILDFCFEGKEKFMDIGTSDITNFTQSYIAVLIRIFRKLMYKLKLKFFNIIEEVQDLAPSQGEPSCKKEIDISERRTRTNEVMVFSTQFIKGTDEKIIKNCSEFIISPETEHEDIKILMNKAQFPTETEYLLIEKILPKSLQLYKKIRFRPWIRISRREGTITPFFPYVDVKRRRVSYRGNI